MGKQIKWSNDEIKRLGILKYGKQFTYDNVNYIKNNIKITVRCQDHGDFDVLPSAFLKTKYGCRKCSVDKISRPGSSKVSNRKLNQEEFIKSCREVHNNYYDYSKVKYINSRTPITIICPNHGEYSVGAREHKRGQKCKKCSNELKGEKSKLNTEQFIVNSIITHGDRYDYSESIYRSGNEKITIICPEHGNFEQVASLHMRKSGCPRCVSHKNYDTSIVINNFKNVHGDKYDYSMVTYVNNNSNIIIGCPENGHGYFTMTSSVHLRGGCQKCAGNYRLDTEEFIIKAKMIHGDKYDYSQLHYKTAHKKIKIICPDHGVFSQGANHHIRGNGCPTCTESSGERDVRVYLENNNITYIPQKRFIGCKSKNTLPFDFYVPKHNLLIEYNGIQHYEPVEVFGGDEGLLGTQKRDKIKEGYAKTNSIPLLVIKYDEDVNEKLDNYFKVV